MSLSKHVSDMAKQLGKMKKEPASKEWFAKYGTPKFEKKKKELSKKAKGMNSKSPLSSEKKERSHWHKMQSEGDRSASDYE